MHSVKHEHFVVYAVDTGESVAEVTPEELPGEQSWTAFSPDGSMFVVGSPLKLTLYRLPKVKLAMLSFSAIVPE